MSKFYFKYFKLAVDDYGALKEEIKKRDNYRCRKCGIIFFSSPSYKRGKETP